MMGMNKQQYLSLIEDTLTHIQQLQTKQKKKEPLQVELPPPPKPQTPTPTFAPKAPTPPKPLTPPPSPVPTEKTEETPFLNLQPLPPPQESANLSTRKVLKEIDPDLFLHENIPSDHKAKRIKEAWKAKRDTPAIPILFQGQKYRSFMVQLAKAIDILYGSCRIVEVEPQKKWDLFLESENLKLIIAPDALIFETKTLLPFYQENPQQKSRKLGKIPLLLLPDLSLYFKDPYLKRALWNVIKTALKKAAPCPVN